MACRDYKVLLPDYSAGMLSPEQAALVKDHLPACDSCRETIRFLKMENASVHAALLGAGKEGASTERRRLVRGVVFLTVLTGLVLLALWLFYKSPGLLPGSPSR